MDFFIDRKTPIATPLLAVAVLSWLGIAPTVHAQKVENILPAISPTAEESKLTPPENMDWFPIEELSGEERKAVNPNCCGAYVEPDRDYREAEKQPEKASLRVGADQTEGEGDELHLSGDVQVSQGYRQIRSDKATINRTDRSVHLLGNITYREPGMLITGDSAYINMDKEEMEVSNVDFVLHESSVRGKAAYLDRPEEDHIHIDNVRYTTCEPSNNDWELRASSIDIDTEKEQATARNVTLKVSDWPVAYLPWVRFPISDKRTTGLLFPSIYTGNENGIDYAQPVYLNLAPDYDATVTPRYLQKRGPMLESEFRHLSSTASTVFSGAILPDDDGGSKNDEYTGENRWSAGVAHEGGFGKNWRSFVDYTDVSDIDYFRDIDSASLAISSLNHLNQEARLGYLTDNWQFGIKGQAFETLIIDGLEQYTQLPRLDAAGSYHLWDSEFIISLKQHWVNFDHSDDKHIGTGTPLTTDAGFTTITGNRYRGRYGITWDKEWLWGFFKPTAAVKYLSYHLNDPLLGETDTSPTATVPVISLDTGLFFERESDLWGGFIQTIEPRFYYLKSEYEDQSAIPNFDTSELTFGYYQLFRDDRFSGGDRIGDTEQFTLGVTSRFIDSDTGIERFRFSLGQVYYIADRRIALPAQLAEELTRKSSDIAIELSARINDYWRVQSDGLTTDDGGTVNKASFALRYNNDEGSVFNLGYRYSRREDVLFANQFIRSDIDQADISLALPINQNWRALARYYHDLRVNKELEVFAGVEYASCCWRVSLVARRWVDPDDRFFVDSDNLSHNTGLFFQVEFRGMAGTGERVTDVLRDGIYGYEPQEF